MSVPTPWNRSHECENVVSTFCQANGYQSSLVFTRVFSQPQIERLIPHARALRSMPAFSIGALIPKLELFGKVIVDREFPVGIIALEKDFESQLADHEKRFILAHEYSHIVKNHAPYGLLGNVASSIVDNYLLGIKDRTTRLYLRFAWSIIQTKVSHAFNRQCELDADANVVALTGDRIGAMNTIRRLGEQYAGSLDAPSHWITRGRLRIPVVTYRERINKL